MTRGGAASGLHGLEDFNYGAGGCDVLVKTGVWVVEKVDINAVGVMLCANGRDEFEGFGDFAPGATSHGAAVID